MVSFDMVPSGTEQFCTSRVNSKHFQMVPVVSALEKEYVADHR